MNDVILGIEDFEPDIVFLEYYFCLLIQVDVSTQPAIPELMMDIQVRHSSKLHATYVTQNIATEH